jgi:NADH-quinone oxidoreductase subunit A
MSDLVGHILVFTVIAVAGLMLPLVIGRFVRPRLPNPETLLFIVFDVEVAFFFPWALVFGGATQLADARLSDEARTEISRRLLDAPQLDAAGALPAEAALTLGWVGLVDILVFFGVLLVGFAYVWKRGDLDWVRAMTQQVRQAAARPRTPASIEPPPRLPEHAGSVR